MALHTERHPEYVEGCFQCKLANVQLGGFPSGPTVTERRWDKDMASYKALRKDGLQPPSVDGASRLETASTQFEIEYGSVATKEELPKVKEGLDRARDLGLSA